LVRQREPALPELSDVRIKHVEDVYFAHLLDEDNDVRLEGMTDDELEGYQRLTDNMDHVNQQGIARGYPFGYARTEAEEVLKWNNVDLKLNPESPSWPKLIRAILSASVRAAAAKRHRNEERRAHPGMIPGLVRHAPLA
jgi:hypothetical protein